MRYCITLATTALCQLPAVGVSPARCRSLQELDYSAYLNGICASQDAARAQRDNKSIGRRIASTPRSSSVNMWSGLLNDPRLSNKMNGVLNLLYPDTCLSLVMPGAMWRRCRLCGII
ncbi:hypothetical protein TNCV_2481011 [Trichonephila clavipes]|nr:hypothetical protein TNCV_2481011 [Trichonephila clavipes]